MDGQKMWINNKITKCILPQLVRLIVDYASGRFLTRISSGNHTTLTSYRVLRYNLCGTS